MSNSANLILLDQYGFKHINQEVLTQITRLRGTDFLMFISSSILKRFSEHPNIQKHLKIQGIKDVKYSETHRVVTNYFKSLMPNGTCYYLAPFSIKKNSNIYGLIFGSGHIKGLEQFLEASWKIDPINGEANFDIDDDQIDLNQPHLFPDMDKSTKIKLFEKELENHLKDNLKILNNKDEINRFALLRGFLPKHTTSIVREFKKDAKLLLK